MKKVISGCALVAIVLLSTLSSSCSYITQTKIENRKFASPTFKKVQEHQTATPSLAKLGKISQEARPTKSAREKADLNAKKMLEKYDLLPAVKMEAEVSQSALIKRLFDNKHFPKFNAASKAIGLDINKCRGKNIWIEGYQVKQYSKYEPVGPRVGFVFDEQGLICGAFMDAADLIGSSVIVPLNEQSKIVSVGVGRSIKR
jgi:hypothetical protein